MKEYFLKRKEKLDQNTRLECVGGGGGFKTQQGRSPRDSFPP